MAIVEKGRETRTAKTSKRPRQTYRVREVVGVFKDPDALGTTVEELELSGFPGSAMSMLASDAKVKDRIGRIYRTTMEAEDDGRAPRASFVSPDSKAEGAGAAVAVPLYVVGIAGALAVAASGGTLALAIAAGLGGGAAGAGLGAVLAAAVARRHASSVEDRLARGGLVLWVSVADEEAEKRALGVFERCDAGDIHVHEVERPWGVEERALHEAQPDPFLQRAGTAEGKSRSDAIGSSRADARTTNTWTVSRLLEFAEAALGRMTFLVECFVERPLARTSGGIAIFARADTFAALRIRNGMGLGG